jgi:hypothetical protein
LLLDQHNQTLTRSSVSCALLLVARHVAVRDQ